MSDRDNFLAWGNTALYEAELALHNGDAARWRRVRLVPRFRQHQQRRTAHPADGWLEASTRRTGITSRASSHATRGRSGRPGAGSGMQGCADPSSRRQRPGLNFGPERNSGPFRCLPVGRLVLAWGASKNARACRGWANTRVTANAPQTPPALRAAMRQIDRHIDVRLTDARLPTAAA